ncbi:RNA polymerase II degradation factor 1-like [Drosophila madeirensis]|uniref:RNA polymerase II degradation factor 1-like n=1 Tax=Drosophila madeirensis TaxID=30013 RepID=A0AAU9FW69_DROMD
MGPYVSQEVRTAVRGGMVWHHQTLHITWASGPATSGPEPEEGTRIWEETEGGSNSRDPRRRPAGPTTATDASAADASRVDASRVDASAAEEAPKQAPREVEPDEAEPDVPDTTLRYLVRFNATPHLIDRTNEFTRSGNPA